MRDAYKMEASVTVPLCIALPVLAVLILALLESARFYGLKSDAKEWANLAAESLFAGYHAGLLEERQLFLYDGGFGGNALKIESVEEELEAFFTDNFYGYENVCGVNLYRMNGFDAKCVGYRLITDENGKVFEVQAANSMKQKLGKRAAEKILKGIQNLTDKQEQTVNTDVYIADAQNAIEDLVRQQEQEKDAVSADVAKQTDQMPQKPQAVSENPMETIKEIKKQGILGMVFPSGKTVSEKQVSVDNCLMKRKIAAGNFKQKEKPGWYERILMQEFVKTNAGNAVDPDKDGALSYGMEYILYGKGSDEENLKKAVKELLWMREGMNFLYLQTDEAKKAEAMQAAMAIGGVSANPLIIPVIKQGILAAWAFAESVVDVKCLLAGGKTPLMKKSADWKTQLMNLGACMDLDSSKETKGLSYENYLDALLYKKTVKQIAYRSMDLMEWHMQNEEKYSNCVLDCMIAGIQIKAVFQTDTLFSGILGKDTFGGWRFIEQAEYVYGKK
ncbi:MAG: hypothetical protein HFI81_05045 [Eubacterium sp.]|jgi:hypothetical protein|nr:hypothetical protein [Eubacterium sp.]